MVYVWCLYGVYTCIAGVHRCTYCNAGVYSVYRGYMRVHVHAVIRFEDVCEDLRVLRREGGGTTPYKLKALVVFHFVHDGACDTSEEPRLHALGGAQSEAKSV